MTQTDSALAKLRKRVATSPTEPGVYRWLGADGTVLYVGKAKNVRNRLRSYVAPGAKLDPWKAIMMKHAVDVDCTVVRSELEAFILESNLIKELKPKYNIMLKDDKGYVYVRVAVQDAYPSVEVVRRLEDDGAKYFGPFLGAYTTNASLDMLDGILHYRACRKSLEALNHPTPGNAKMLGTPCLEHQIGKCCGLCIGSVSQQEYRDRIDEVQRFFRGNFQSVKKRAETAMLEAANLKKFERAARLRDVLKFIAELESKQVVSDASGENADVFGIAYRHGKMHVVLLRERDGKVIEQVHLALKGEADTAAEAMAQFLPQYYADTQDIPDLLVVRDPLPEGEIFTEWLKQKAGKSVEIRVPERGKKSKLLELAEKNAEEKVRQQFAAWEAELRKAEDAVLSLQSLLKLSHPPKRIEGYDISHLGGTETVGSMVVFEHGKPKRAHYRSFNITTVRRGDIDDYQSLAEVLKRRLKYVAFDLKSEQARLKASGVEVGKARKPEQKRIDAIVHAHADYAEGDTSSYKEFFVARRGKDIVGIVQLAARTPALRVVQCLWSAEGEGEPVRRILVRTALASQEKGKMYALVDALQEEWHAQLGFRHVIEAHPELDARAKVLQKQKPDSHKRIVLSYDVRKEKPDESFASLPDVLLIDGGKGQLGAVYDVLRGFGLDGKIALASLAKREEEIFVPGSLAPLSVPQGDAAQFLLQRIRDESHRFANEKRKGRATKTTFASALDDVQGIGPQLKKELLLRFGSVDRIRDADDEALRAILNEKQLAALRKQFSA